MVSWVTAGYNLGLRQIEMAYRSSKEAFEKEIARIEYLRTDFQRRRPTSKTAESEAADGYEDVLIDMNYDAEVGLRLIREAFALTLYHFWEKELNTLLNVGKGDHLKLMGAIKSSGRLQVDAKGLERLRLIANTIKHNDGHKLYASEPGMFGPEAKNLEPSDRRGWHNFLRLTDDDILRSIATVRASGPGARWDRGGGEIDEVQA